MNDIQDKLFEHEGKLAKVETILERVAVNQDKMAEAVAQISSSILKQELILEKLSSLETHSKGSFDRIHSRVDSLYSSVNNLNVKQEALEATVKDILVDSSSFSSKLDDLELFSLFRKYPIVAILVSLGVFSLSFAEVRSFIIDIVSIVL